MSNLHHAVLQCAAVLTCAAVLQCACCVATQLNVLLCVGTKSCGAVVVLTL